jgi:hypothetical protein
MDLKESVYKVVRWSHLTQDRASLKVFSNYPSDCYLLGKDSALWS